MNNRFTAIVLFLALAFSQGLTAQIRVFGNCDKLDKKYASEISSKKKDIAFLEQVLEEYSESCMGSEVYYRAAKYLQEQKPSYLSSAICAFYTHNIQRRARQAIPFYEKASELASDKRKQAEILCTIAEIYYRELKNMQQARVYAERAIAVNPQELKAYELVAELYANSSVSRNSVADKAKYWLAVDVLEQAIEAAPETVCTEKQYMQIQRYSKKFPTKAEIQSQRDMQEGKTYRVGGWIGRNTVCRAKDESLDEVYIDIESGI